MNVKVNKFKKYMYTLLISIVCFLFTPITVEACELESDVGIVDVINFNETTEDIPTEIKEPIEKGLSLLEYFVITIGIVVIIIGGVLLAINFFGHQNDMKVAGFIAIGVGMFLTVIPIFAHWIAGR